MSTCRAIATHLVVGHATGKQVLFVPLSERHNATAIDSNGHIVARKLHAEARGSVHGNLLMVVADRIGRDRRMMRDLLSIEARLAALRALRVNVMRLAEHGVVGLLVPVLCLDGAEIPAHNRQHALKRVGDGIRGEELIKVGELSECHHLENGEGVQKLDRDGDLCELLSGTQLRDEAPHHAHYRDLARAPFCVLILHQTPGGLM